MLIEVTSELPRHGDIETTVLTICMMPVYQVSINIFSFLWEVIKVEVTNLTRLEDQKMKRIEIMHEGVRTLLWTVCF